MYKNKKKIMILGGFNSARNTILRNMCDKTIQTVAMEYGNTQINDTQIHFFSVPPVDQFKFMYSILSKDLDGAVIIIDKCGLDKFELKLSETFKEENLPYIIITDEKTNELEYNIRDYENVLFSHEITEEDLSEGIDILLKEIDSKKYEKNHTLCSINCETMN